MITILSGLMVAKTAALATEGMNNVKDLLAIIYDVTEILGTETAADHRKLSHVAAWHRGKQSRTSL